MVADSDAKRTRGRPRLGAGGGRIADYPAVRLSPPVRELLHVFASVTNKSVSEALAEIVTHYLTSHLEATDPRLYREVQQLLKIRQALNTTSGPKKRTPTSDPSS